MAGVTQAQRSNNLRTGLTFGAIALTFFLAIVAKYYWLNS
ncbi:MAG: cytochrome oxidase small assembly protein [Burkholderiales bacterium]